MTTEHVRLAYLRIELPGRNSVREPFPPPRVALVGLSGDIVLVELTEAELQQMIVDAGRTLKLMRQAEFHARRAGRKEGEGSQ